MLDERGCLLLLPSGSALRAWKCMADREAADNEDAEEILHREMTKAADEFLRVWDAAAAGEQAMQELTPCLTFDGLVHVLSTLHVLQPLVPSAEPFIRYSCSCRYFQDLGKCKHALREGLRAKQFVVHEDMQLGVIGREKKGLRRQPKTTGSRQHQPGEHATLGNLRTTLLTRGRSTSRMMSE